MAIDASIPLGVKPVQIDSPLNALAQIAQVQGAQQQNQLLGLKMQQEQRSMDDVNALRAGLAAPGADPYKVLLGQGKVKEAAEYQKSQGDAQKQQADLLDTKLKQSRAFLDNVQTPEQYIAWHQANHADPVLGPALAAHGVTQEQSMASIQQALAQPGGFQDLLRKSALGLEKFTELNKPTTTTVNAGGSSDVLQIPGLGGAPQTVATVQHTQSPDNAATVGATIRGQDLTDARARETSAQGKTQIVETPQGFQLVDKNTGQSRPALGPDGEPLKGKANDRVMTDSQAKANLFGTRMREADRILGELDGKYSPAAVNFRMGAADMPVVGGLVGYAANAAASPQTQQAEQAQRDFVNAVLRRESGAAISASEFANARQQYFSQPNDSAEVKAQKARNRALAISGLEAEVPGGFRTSPSLTNPAAGGGAAPASAAPMRVQNAADYAKVPKGAQYVTPDGHTRVKQ